MVYGVDSYQGNGKSPELAGRKVEFRVVIRPRQRRALPVTPAGRLQDLSETSNTHIRYGSYSHTLAFKKVPAAWPD